MDRSIGAVHVPNALRKVGEQVVLLDDEFPEDVMDEVWIDRVGEKGWIALTKDQGIRRRPFEVESFLRSTARVFIFASGNTPGPMMAEVIVKALPAIKNIVHSTRPPFLGRIEKSGRVSLFTS